MTRGFTVKKQTSINNYQMKVAKQLLYPANDSENKNDTLKLLFLNKVNRITTVVVVVKGDYPLTVFDTYTPMVNRYYDGDIDYQMVVIWEDQEKDIKNGTLSLPKGWKNTVILTVTQKDIPLLSKKKLQEIENAKAKKRKEEKRIASLPTWEGTATSVCSRCGGSSFTVAKKLKGSPGSTKADVITQETMCHAGFGWDLNSFEFKCCHCGGKSKIQVSK
jgi:hypothetical protein